MSDAVVAEGVSKRYGETVALDGVSLSVERGEVFGLVGPNGAGKTTLVRALTGTTSVEGRVETLDAHPTAVDPARIGLLPQSFSPAGRLTARELVAYYAGLYDGPRDVEGVLADVGMATDDRTRYENLSGGQRRRVCVATALVNDPDLLFLDEPTTGIDPAGRRAIRSLLADLAGHGTTIFLTSHSMADVERLADRVGLLAAGDLVAVGSPARLVAEYGGESRLEVETDATGDAPGSLAGRDVASTDRGLVVHGVDPADIGNVVAGLEAAGVDYGSLTWRQPDLEDVFLRLTDEEAGDAREGDPRRTTTVPAGGSAPSRAGDDPVGSDPTVGTDDESGSDRS